MIERRNFYRILHVQPDAPMTVIRESFRVLKQKLEMRSDLDGPDWNASLLNIAFNTLRDPRKRAVYDRELLKRYHIKTLSQGALGVISYYAAEEQGDGCATYLNQRNYYRILQVQPDAPNVTITASYQALKKSFLQDAALLDEAYRILSDPAMRQRYDVLFAKNVFRNASKNAQLNTDLPVPAAGAKNTSQHAVEPYRAVITHYCLFCKVPYVPQANVYQNENCLECASPLRIVQHQNRESSRRATMRMTIRGEFNFYLYWPGESYQGLFQDLSPSGIRFLTDVMLDSNDIIKIDAPNFQAVAEVTHKRYEGKGISVGTRFIAAKFDRQHGNFVMAQA
jgi:curved DNA-binding protein CbpA